jgi:hypothetical protein
MANQPNPRRHAAKWPQHSLTGKRERNSFIMFSKEYRDSEKLLELEEVAYQTLIRTKCSEL